MKEHKMVQLEDHQNVRTKVEGMNPHDNQQACKPNLCRYEEQVGWEDVTVQQRYVHDLPHHSMVVELFDEVKVDNHF